MVCHFGIGTEAKLWLAQSGADVLRGFRRRTDVLAAAAAAGPEAAAGGGGAARRQGGWTTAFVEEPKDGEPGATQNADKRASESEPPQACFPASASVFVKGVGRASIADLRPGNEVLCGDEHTGLLLFSPFLGYMHKEVASTDEYIALNTAGASSPLLVSRDHLVFATRRRTGLAHAGDEEDKEEEDEEHEERAEAVPAGDLREGDRLRRVACDGGFSHAPISSAPTAVTAKGRYAPLTVCGTVIVDGALCSCYVDAFPKAAPGWLRSVATTHEAAHGALLPLRAACRLASGLGLGGLGAAAAAAPEGIHPYCRALMALPYTVQVLA